MAINPVPRGQFANMNQASADSPLSPAEGGFIPVANPGGPAPAAVPEMSPASAEAPEILQGRIMTALAEAKQLLKATSVAEFIETATALAATPEAGAAVGAVALAWQVLDPARILAMGPQSGLTVTPVTFQSTEQEGRWKPQSVLNNTLAKAPSNAGVPSPRLFATTVMNESKWYRVAPGLEEDGTFFGKNRTHTTKLFTIRCPGGSEVIVDAKWWSDGLEIHAGYAGMASAKGFGSVYSNNASIALQAIPYGNYLPASSLITWSGWVNSVGAEYAEIRGACIVSATGKHGKDVPGNDAEKSDNPTFMEYWNRDGEVYQVPNTDDGFVLEFDFKLY